MRILLLIFCFGISLISSAQVYLQLELFNDPKARKFAVGQKITYKVDYLQDVWQKGTIKEILVDEKTLILDNSLVSLDQITDFMLFRTSVNYFGRTLQTFGTLYTVFGVIAIARDDAKVSQVLSIGGGSFLVGWLMRKLFYRVPISLGEKNRLRIVDLRFYVPDENP